MPKLKTQGVITAEEYRQAERDGTFLIADTVACTYCDQPVSVDTDPQYLYCPHHYKLVLSLHWYPGYPAIPKDAPRYKQMHFHLPPLQRNRPRFVFVPPEREYIATEKGCPFCQRYMTPVDPRIEKQPDASLLNQKMFCSECGVSFLIEVIDVIGVLQLRFRVDAKHLPPTENDTDPKNDVHSVPVAPESDTLTQETLDPEADVAPRAATRVSAVTAENTIKDFQAAYGCSYERARQLWHDAGGKQHKDEVEAQLRRRARQLHEEQGRTLTEIANILDRNKSTISRWLKE